MEVSRRDFKVMMFNGHMRDLHQEKSHENLKQLFSKSTPSRTQFFSWFGEFRRSRRSFEDHWCVTSATAVTIANIEAAEKLIRVEPRITTREIQKSLSIGTAATMSISHDHLRVRKRCARWTPHSLTNNDGLGLKGASSRCESSTGAVLN